jgi:hypothetical protein
MRQLSLFGRIIFVDWHGVISGDPFWTSILQSQTHPLRPQLENKLSELFSQNTRTLDWMKGAVTSEEIVSQLNIDMDRRFNDDFLIRRLDADCRRMRANVDLLNVLQKLAPIVPVVLATDNMDCFARAIEQARSGKRPSSTKPDGLIFVEWAKFCDEVLCSSELGALKSEDPVRFFGPLLLDYGLQFSDALLIDDRADNCEAFRQQGGAAVQWKMGANDVEEVSSSVYRWLGW